MPQNVEERTKREKSLVFKVFILQILFVLAFWASKEVFGCPSRRMCNLPFCLYQISLINSFLLYLLVIDRLMT